MAPSCGRGQAAGGKGAAELEPGGAKFPRMRQRRTLRHVIGCAGVGLHSGARVAVTLRPAAEGSGIRFRRVDRLGAPTITALPRHALVSDGVVCLADAAGGSVRMVEHLLAALAVCEIDDILVEIRGAELPAMDGTALPFVRLMECAGTVELASPVASLEVVRPIEVAMAAGYARLEPAGEPGLSLEVRDTLAIKVTPETCKRELVSARAATTRHSDVEADEAGRHALLDALGSLALVPALISARYIEHNADAQLRCALVRAIVAASGSCRIAGVSLDKLAMPDSAVLQRAS